MRPDHPYVATMLNNLGLSVRALGRPGDAMVLHRRALAVTEAAAGPDHPDVALRLSNLAGAVVAPYRWAASSLSGW